MISRDFLLRKSSTWKVDGSVEVKSRVEFMVNTVKLVLFGLTTFSTKFTSKEQTFHLWWWIHLHSSHKSWNNKLSSLLAFPSRRSRVPRPILRASMAVLQILYPKCRKFSPLKFLPSQYQRRSEATPGKLNDRLLLSFRWVCSSTRQDWRPVGGSWWGLWRPVCDRFGSGLPTHF